MDMNSRHDCLFPLFFVVVTTLVVGLNLAAQTKVQPSSHITAIDTRTGVVAAKVDASGEDFRFTLINPALLSTLKIGEGVYANLQTKQVSLDGQHVAGTIVSIGASKGTLAPASPIAPSGATPGSKAPVTPSSFPSPTGMGRGGTTPPPAQGPRDAAPACCGITSIDARQNLASARENSTGRSFQFKANNPTAMASLRAGQHVYANFPAKQVSLDGKSVFGVILTLEGAGAFTPKTETSGASSGQGSMRQTPGNAAPSVSTEKPTISKPGSAGTSGVSSGAAHGADPFVLIDAAVHPATVPEGIGQTGTLYFVNVTTGNQGTAPSNNNYTVNLAVTDGSGKQVCSAARDVTSTVDANSNFTALRAQVRQSGAAQPASAAAGGLVTPVASVLVPYTLNASLRFWQTPTDPTADLNTQNDQAQATVQLPSGTVECVVASPPQIEAFKVMPSVMPGGQQGYATILLNTPPTFAVTSNGTVNETLNLQLSSNQPQVSVPPNVSIQYPNLVADFAVDTSPVAAPQTATVSATSSVQTGSFTNVTVRPPQLLSLACLPVQVASGTPIHCTVQLDGKVYGPAGLGVGARQTAVLGGSIVPTLNNFVTVNLTTDHPALVHAPTTVNVFGGSDATNVDIPTVGDAQGAQITVSASQAAITRTVAVTLTAALIKSFGCYVGNPGPTTQDASSCMITPWSGKPYGLALTLTAPQSQSLQISVDEPGRYHHASCALGPLSIPAGTPQTDIDLTHLNCPSGGCLNQVFFWQEYFEPVPQAETHTLIVRDPLSGATYTTTFLVMPARIMVIGFGPTLSSAQNPLNLNSLAGQDLTVWVSFDSPPAPTDWNSVNAWLDVRYGGNVSIQGPTNVPIHEQDFCNSILTGPQHWWSNFKTYMSFDATVGACSAVVNPNGCTATVTVSSNQALGSQTGTINVTPQ